MHKKMYLVVVSQILWATLAYAQLPNIPTFDLKSTDNIHIIFGNTNAEPGYRDPQLDDKIRLLICRPTPGGNNCKIDVMGDRTGDYMSETDLEAAARLINEHLASGHRVTLKGATEAEILAASKAIKQKFPPDARKYIQFLELKKSSDAFALSNCLNRCPAAQGAKENSPPASR